jgi:NADPH:quinone reductase-like Zn-dependent oxidoreductase
MAAWVGLIEYAHLKAGETLVVFGSSGGVGSAAVQIAKRLGARVIGIDRSKPSADNPTAKLADVLLSSGDQNLSATLRSANAGRGADVVFNAAGGPVFEIALTLLANRGRQIEITTPMQRKAAIDVVDFYHNESQLLGVDTLKRDLTASARILEKLAEGFEQGSFLPPVIAQTVPLAGAGQAYERVARGEHGRVVLKPSIG